MALLGLVGVVSGCGDDDDGARKTLMPVSLGFSLELGGEPFECEREYANVGDPPAPFTMTDARLYLHAIELLDAAGAARRITLDQNAFQGSGIALLDFENGCGPDGTPETNDVVTGTIPSGSYEGVRFTLGVPPEHNFIDLARATPPMDVTGMYWVWLSGYKYLKLDGSTPSAEGGIHPFLLHLGASECPGGNPQAPPTAACAAPNQVTYLLDGFSPDRDTIVADLTALFAATDLTFNTDGTAPGCMSESRDPECVNLLPRIGVDDAENQKLFRIR